MQRQFHVYITTNKKNGTLYVGVSNDIIRRVHEHREGLAPGFTSRYGLKRLVHVEGFNTAMDAITREKQLKKWNRAWKIRLIEGSNPGWDDLYEGIAS